MDTTADLVAGLTVAAPRPILDLPAYQALFATLPAAMQNAVLAAWGAPREPFLFRYMTLGHVTIAVEPSRGEAADRRAGYHDPDRPPCHGYVAFHLWLRRVRRIHALVQLGAHGVLEWLPGKAAALSEACIPQALLGPTPVIYPFIANNPGEAAAAKRRLGAVIIGHLTPPLRAAGLHGEGAELERLIDELAAADGLDRTRARLLQRAILDRAQGTGLLDESGAPPGTPDEEALARPRCLSLRREGSAHPRRPARLRPGAARSRPRGAARLPRPGLPRRSAQ